VCKCGTVFPSACPVTQAVLLDVPGHAKVRALTGIDGRTLREWRRSRGRDVPKTARELRHVASEPVAASDALVRMIRGWERGDHELSERYELLYRRLGLERAQDPAQVTARKPGPDRVPDDAQSVTAWVAATNTTDDAIEEMDRAATYLAEIHAQVPARKVLGEVLALNRDVHSLLRGGRQRLRQTRYLLQIHSRLMAHACVLLGDLGRAQAAREYGTATLLLAQEAEADEAIAWTVQAKTARWTGGFVEAAEFARRGFEVSAPTPTRVELAYREANAIALFGDAPRARKALQQAEHAAEALSTSMQGASVWSFPAGRQALFSLSVAIHTGDAVGALRAAATAEAGWNAGAPKALATWAQVRAGAAMAHLMLNSLDGAAAQIGPVLELSPEMRIDTVIGYLRTLDQMLTQPRFAGSGLATALRQQIGEFISAPAAC
jgi:hypothetical protein